MQSQFANAQNPVAGEPVAIDETEDLIASDKVEGTAVYNRSGETLGSVYTLMIDKHAGKVRYAVMSFGGFLGMGERYHALPWDALRYDRQQAGYVVDVTREQLQAAPSYTREDAPWADPAYGRYVHNYYGMPHYML